jgi:hypothetical protein
LYLLGYNALQSVDKSIIVSEKHIASNFRVEGLAKKEAGSKKSFGCCQPDMFL